MIAHLFQARCTCSAWSALPPCWWRPAPWATAARHRGIEVVGHLARHRQGWQDRRGARPRTVADRHPDESGGATRCQRPLGTGARDGTGHRGGGGYAHQPRQGPDASRASDRTRHRDPRPPDWGPGHAHYSPLTVPRRATRVDGNHS